MKAEYIGPLPPCTKTPHCAMQEGHEGECEAWGGTTETPPTSPGTVTGAFQRVGRRAILGDDGKIKYESIE